ncbi:hypothetical protein LYZ37_16635 [Vibrio tubiashii]|uniref:hypothetical protein n=1 Tax=Vibrio tubiashii TaxID=29498 RepID=UPI00234E46D1|nr:hypothetical protein [Vibrio tubiashii]WCP69645.1 hypothetical protein LYZ37_16635 [Vibrio tubiashii]
MKYLMKYWLAVLVVLVQNVHAYELDMKSKLDADKFEYKNTKTIKGMGKPVHENLIVQSVLAAHLPHYSEEDKRELIEGLVLGVRWNDDPLHMFRLHSVTASALFAHSCKRKTAEKINVQWDLFYRSHCGDMQFLHAMASKKQESAQETYQKLEAWLEFTYKTSTGSLPTDLRFRSVHFRMSPQAAATFKAVMIHPNGGRSLWRAEGMFSFDCTRSWFGGEIECEYIKFSKENIRNIALGSLLHVIQDSYSESHTQRDTSGKIVRFGAYTMQDKGEHAKKDESVTTPHKVSLVDVSAKIIEAALADRQKSYPFDTVVRTELDSWARVKSEYLLPVILPNVPTSTPSNLGLGK